MGAKKYNPEEIVDKLHQIDVLADQGIDINDAMRQVEISKQTYYRWRKKYGSHSFSFSNGSKAYLKRMDVVSFLKSQKDSSVDLIVTDPAYSGMNQHLMLGRGRIVGTYKNRDSDNGKWFSEFVDTEENYEVFLTECHRLLKPNSHIFLMFDSYSLISLAPIVRKVFDLKNIITWNKVHFGMGHYFRRQSEHIVFASKGKRPLTSKGIPDIWNFKRIHPAKYPTQKPVELFRAMIASSTIGNDSEFVVLDPFMGSGSSAVASIMHGVSYFGCDISDKSIEATTDRLNALIKGEPDPLQKKSAISSITKTWWEE
jgi:site-specific DNA-methyltransferase (adenine-specific)